MRVKDKIALVTGASSGIGAACVQLLEREGAKVIITGINDDEGEELAKQIGKNACYYHLDVSKQSDWESAANSIKKNFDQLDILVNNAGVTGHQWGPQDPEYASLESWKDVHAINLDGVFLGCKYGISLMKKRGGSIVNISSRSGLVGIPSAAAYASSKAAVRNHTKSVAIYCAQENYKIRCNSIHPGAILTPMWDSAFGIDENLRKQAIEKISREIPLKKMGEAIDVAYAVLYLTSEESKYITGIELNIDGGILAGSSAAPKA